MTENAFDPVVIVIGRSDVECGDISFTLEALEVLMQSAGKHSRLLRARNGLKV